MKSDNDLISASLEPFAPKGGETLSIPLPGVYNNDRKME